MAWTLHKQPPDFLTDHQYSIFDRSGKVIVLINSVPGHEDKLPLIVHAVNNIDRITAERDSLRKALEKLDAMLDFGSTWDCIHTFDDVDNINQASQEAYELLATLRVSEQDRKT